MSSEEVARSVPQPAKGEPVRLTDAKAMRALAHPVRMALLELLHVRRTLTATQASEALGESSANCAFHLRTLAKYGYVHETGGGKGRERPWTLTNWAMTVDTKQADPQAAIAAQELSRHWLERWIDRARRVFGSPNQVPGWDQASGYTDSLSFLTANEAEELREEMRRLLDRYAERQTNPALRPEGALPVQLTIFAAPIAEWAEVAALDNEAAPRAPAPAAPDEPNGTDNR